MSAGSHNREVEIQSRETTIDPIYGTNEEVQWTTIATVWAEVQDMLPSRAERVDNGISMSQRPTRVRMLFRDDVTSAMRFVVKGRSPGEADRVLRITAGPAELGFRERVEFMAAEYSSSGEEV
ncbi:head-tail adaptor protein [Novosphingobium sp. JCM 18896]|uniref:head-tail adaptor protein n=1 Tax=Novosphingobium sp. JCM 18896 TaxID=2989731 RepID=UPI002222D4A3|nr:head-tail adaptor protein [Novosphingobium sp. JCM 18896]MCW1431400.1 head-tail adaptor protein [Novosphingobium sp. JCM 18896]